MGPICGVNTVLDKVSGMRRINRPIEIAPTEIASVVRKDMIFGVKVRTKCIAAEEIQSGMKSRSISFLILLGNE
jgi:hypothetical protein